MATLVDVVAVRWPSEEQQGCFPLLKCGRFRPIGKAGATAPFARPEPAVRCENANVFAPLVMMGLLRVWGCRGSASLLPMGLPSLWERRALCSFEKGQGLWSF